MVNRLKALGRTPADSFRVFDNTLGEEGLL